METKKETRYYFFDKKNASYYKNEFLNNCKTRSNYIKKLYNNINTMRNNLDYLKEQEFKKDPKSNYNSKLDCIINAIDDIYETIKQYEIDVSEECVNLQSMNFEKIMEENTEKIKSQECDNDGREIVNEDKE